MIDERVVFDEVQHRYFDRDSNVEYESCNKLIDKFIIPFNEKKMSRNVAKGQGKTQEEVLKEWHGKRDDSHMYGNENHKIIEDYYKEGKKVSSGHKMYDALNITINLLSQYKAVYSEENIALPEHGIAGKPDLLCIRDTRTKVVDIPDIKTNKYNGIKMDTIKRFDDNDQFITYTGKPKKHYNRFFLDPISHLEQSGYNRYCLQTSIYAFMMEQSYGYKIGSLSILFYFYCKKSKKMKVRRYPIPYMRAEILDMLKANKEMKKL